MCNCQTWCRVPTNSYPMSDHAPGCEDYKPEEFSRVEYDGSACVMEPHEAAALVADSDCKYLVTPVMLTREQFERMGDFRGW